MGGYAGRGKRARKRATSSKQPSTLLTHPGLQESVSGMLRVLEDGRELQARFHDYKGDEIPW